MLDEVDDDMAELRHVSKHIKLGSEGDGLPHGPPKKELIQLRNVQ